MTMIALKKYKQMLLYGLALAAFFILLHWLEVHFILMQHEFEIYAGLIAVLFTGLGIWLTLNLRKSEVIYLPPQDNFVLNEKEVANLGLSTREVEVLQLMAQGKSNQEIADRLFISLNTVKTHNSKLFEKMEVKRRTQAIQIGKKLAIIP